MSSVNILLLSLILGAANDFALSARRDGANNKMFTEDIFFKIDGFRSEMKIWMKIITTVSSN